MVEDNEVPAFPNLPEGQELSEDQELPEVYELDEAKEETTKPGREPANLEPDNVETEDEEVDHQQNPTEFECPDCGKTFREKRRLVDHITDVHAERKVCTLCPQTFSNTRNFNRHMRQIHRTQGSTYVCCNCGKELSSQQSLTNHEERCNGNQEGKSKLEPTISCRYCEMKFTTSFSLKRHEQKKHVMETPGGYMLINNTGEDSTPAVQHLDATEFICKVCPIPFKLSNQKTFEKHSKKMHNGRDDQIRYL